MGKFVRFVCHYCKSVGSTWVGDEDKPICSFCYDKGIELLAEDEQSVTCPKCAKTGLLTRVNKIWD